MIYSYTQINHYLACPRRYRYRYLQGWAEKEIRANLFFGRAFETALNAYFLREDAAVAFFREWSKYRDLDLTFSKSDSWDSWLQSGFQLLDWFGRDDRVRVPRPKQNLQVKFERQIFPSNEFVAYIDAIGTIDKLPCLIDWKTAGARYPDNTEDLLCLDPQLLCYSWMTGKAEVAFIVFVRKRIPEIQYLKATISDQQRSEFGRLVEKTIHEIEGGHFPQHSGIRFPQSGCLSCSYVGLCLCNDSLVQQRLTRRKGEDFAWLDELAS